MHSFVLRLTLLLCLCHPALAAALAPQPMVAAGYAHTLALMADGTVQAWGDNSYAQLGIGSVAGSLVPKKVLGGVVAIAAGDSHSLALKADGSVVAWGDNSSGQMGDGTSNTAPRPKTVKGLVGMVAVAAGNAHSVALKSDGTVMVWGYNGDGELGNGTINDSLSPIPVAGLSGVTAISVGPSGYHTLALKSDGTVVAWGFNGDGELGNGLTDNSLVPVTVPGLNGVIAVSAGDSHSVALKKDGTVMAWGSNAYGQLGDGTGNDSLTPVLVPGLSGVVAVSAGDAHTLALKSDGTVVAWGYNGDGELGDGSGVDSLSPVAVPGLAGVVAIAAGYYHSAAAKSDGVIVGWGYNGDGELGDGTSNDSLVPVEAYGLVSVQVCDLSSAVRMVNTCAPEINFYVTGSSALNAAISTVIETDLFDTTSQPAIRILDDGSPNGSAGAGAASGWYGMSKAALTGGASKRLFVVYNNNRGSGSGVSQVLVNQGPAKPAQFPEADVVTIGPVKTGANNTAANHCTADAASTPPAPIVACMTHAPMQADLAISDVNASELYRLENPVSGRLPPLTKLSSTPLALQGFGLAVNANLYAALQHANLAEGLIPPACSAGDGSAACQPTLRRNDYASLVSGTIASAAALFNNGDATPLTLARLVDTSGTQSASNIFFARNPCQSDVTSKGKVLIGMPGGQLNIRASANSTPALTIQSHATTRDVISALNAPGGYAIGVLGLGNVPGAGDTWRYIRLDGVSPDFNLDGTADAGQRSAFSQGRYPFAMTAYAITLAKPLMGSVGKLYPALVAAVENGLKDSTLHAFTGIGYLDHAANAAQSLVARGGPVGALSGNNCAPLIR